MFLGNVVALANERGGRLVLGMADARPHKVVGSDFAVNETGISSDFKIDLTATRTKQLCDAMTVSKDLMANLLLAAGGRGGIGVGGSGSTSELTNWDGTKKNTGWGI